MTTTTGANVTTRPAPLTRLLILGSGDTALGLALLLGGPARTSSDAFRVIKTYAPITVWGAVLFLIGSLLLLGLLLHRSVVPAVHSRITGGLAIAGAMWGAFWFTALLQSAHADPRVALTGPVAYSFYFTVPHLALAFGREG